MGLATDPVRRHQNYAGWLVETACDFLVEKGAGGVWTLLPDNTLELFFAKQGFWSVGCAAEKTFGAADLPESCGVCRRSSSEAYERRREKFLQGRSHVVLGPALTALQQELAERSGGGLFQITLPGGETACAIAFKKGGTAVIRELLGAAGQEREAMALLARALETEQCVYSTPLGMLRLMGCCAKMERPEGYLGCGLL